MKLKLKKSFSEPKLWRKLNEVARKVGIKVVYPVVLLYYLFKSKEVPLYAKSMIAGALAYFIMPFDGLPDFLPIIGYTDDLSLLAATVHQLLKHISHEILEQTRNKTRQWFNNEEDTIKMEEQIKLLRAKTARNQVQPTN